MHSCLMLVCKVVVFALDLQWIGTPLKTNPHPFRVKDCVEGGERAAHALRTHIKKHLKERYPDTNTDNWQIMVWCIAAMDGLANAYEISLSQKDGFTGINFTTALRRFAIGFNRGAHYTFNFIDVGGGRGLKLKEITDAKLRDTFRMSE